MLRGPSAVSPLSRASSHERGAACERARPARARRRRCDGGSGSGSSGGSAGARGYGERRRRAEGSGRQLEATPSCPRAGTRKRRAGAAQTRARRRRQREARTDCGERAGWRGAAWVSAWARRCATVGREQVVERVHASAGALHAASRAPAGSGAPGRAGSRDKARTALWACRARPPAPDPNSCPRRTGAAPSSASYSITPNA